MTTTIQVTSILKDFLRKNITITVSKIVKNIDEIINISIQHITFDSEQFDEQIIILNELGETEYFNRIISKLTT